MKHFSYVSVLCMVLQVVFVNLGFAQSYTYGGNQVQQNTVQSGGYTYGGNQGGGSSSNQQQYGIGQPYKYGSGGYVDPQPSTSTPYSGYVIGEEKIEESHDLIMPWMRETYVSIDPFLDLISNNLGYSGGGLDVNGRVAIVNSGKEKYPSELFALALGANLFLGRQNTTDTASVVGRAGIDFQTDLQLDDNPNDLILDFQFGIGYDFRFGEDDANSDSSFFFWGRFMATFESWEGLGGTHPRVIWNINGVPRSGGLGSKVALQLNLSKSDSQSLFVGVVWAYSYLPKKTQLNGIGAGADFYFLVNSTTLHINAEVLYNMEQIGTNKDKDGVSVFFSIGVLIF